MTGILKNTVILSNYTEEEVFQRVTSKYSTRLRRRTIWSNVGSDPWLLKYVRPYFSEFKIEPELVRFHFWTNVLRLQRDRAWLRSTQSLFEKEAQSYFDFCRENGFESHLKVTDVGFDSQKTQGLGTHLESEPLKRETRVKLENKDWMQSLLEKIKKEVPEISDSPE